MTETVLQPDREIFDFSDLRGADDKSSYHSENDVLIRLAAEKFEQRKKGDARGQIRNLSRFAGRTYGRSIYEGREKKEMKSDVQTQK